MHICVQLSIIFHYDVLVVQNTSFEVFLMDIVVWFETFIISKILLEGVKKHILYYSLATCISNKIMRNRDVQVSNEVMAACIEWSFGVVIVIGTSGRTPSIFPGA